MDKTMFLRVISPDSSTDPVECDDILFQIPNGIDGNGDGFFGIHPNFENAVIALSPCRLIAKLNQQVCFQVDVKEGSINVENNLITVLTDIFSIV